MFKILNFCKLTLIQLLIFFSFFSNINASNLYKNYSSKEISNYFLGIISLSDNEYENSYKFLKKLEGLEQNHSRYSRVYINSLVNLNKINQAFKYSKKLEKENLDNFESNFIISVFYFKNQKPELAKNYLEKIKTKFILDPVQDYLVNSMLRWVQLNSLSFAEAEKLFDFDRENFKNVKAIEKVFLYCYFKRKNTSSLFENLLFGSDGNFSRYNFFFANYLHKIKKNNRAKEIINKSLIEYPNNLILNQMKFDLKNKKKFNNKFNCEELTNISAEIFYVISNALSSQQFFNYSNFYLNLAKYLNPNFISYNTLIAENLYISGKLSAAKIKFNNILFYGDAYEWYAAKQIASILNEEKKEKLSIDFLSNKFKKIDNPSIYQIYDYASFLKNKEKFEVSIIYYTKVLDLIDNKHKLYPKAKDGRGISYERTDQWKKAEKDFLDSLKFDSEQAYVINYLAYSWIEKGINIEKALSMLKKANELKRNDGYITDSLGWAFFKLKRYTEAEKYLQLAVKLMPSDPIVNDHYGDTLWMNGKKLQARFYWKYVLNLEGTKKKIKRRVE
ncbi:MAG: hypothetical protein CBD76_01225 [Pelagibacteraceae bacterium TMED216]|nr:MAG: hypothetical protein CBD76_01225 [Pelagibacteraceae bacterium TMED216]